MHQLLETGTQNAGTPERQNVSEFSQRLDLFMLLCACVRVARFVVRMIEGQKSLDDDEWTDR